MPQQFDLRRDATGWTVFDRWTGQGVVIAHVPQSNLSWREATEIARRLNARSGEGDRSILQ